MNRLKINKFKFLILFAFTFPLMSFNAGSSCENILIWNTVDPFSSIYEGRFTVDGHFNGSLGLNGEYGMVEVLIIDEVSGNTLFDQTYGNDSGSFSYSSIPVSISNGPFGSRSVLVRYTFTAGINTLGGAEVGLAGQDCI